MAKKSKAQISDLVYEWTNLDNPETVKNAVDTWTGKKPYKEKSSLTGTVKVSR